MQKLSFQVQVLTGFVVTLAVVFFLAVVSYLSIKDLDKSQAVVTHTEAVLRLTNKVKTQMVEAESSLRGFLITGSTEFLNRYNYVIDKIEPSISELGVLVSDNKNQKTNIDSLEFYGSLRVDHLKTLLAAYQSAGYSGASAQMKAAKGKFYMDQVYDCLNRIQSIENRLLADRKEKSQSSRDRTITIVLSGSLIILILILVLFNYIRRTFFLQKLTEEKLRESSDKIQRVSIENQRQNWLLEGAVIVDSAMRGAQTLDERAVSIVVEISKYVGADLGVIYIYDDEKAVLKLRGTYAYPQSEAKPFIKPKEGLIGQAVIQHKGILFTEIPESYVSVGSGMGQVKPAAIFIQPIFLNEKLKAVIELAFVREVNPYTAELFEKVVYSIGVAIAAAEARVEMMRLFEQTQQQAEELESQHEELRTTNEELTRKTQQLQASEEELMVQQEELRQTNSELEEKAELLEERNRAIEDAHKAIQQKAEEIEQTSKYKSEFLANMSHELRTPLNSILILAKILKENKQGTLSEEQMKYAGVIHTAGSDLLTLINDILDLSKIESGKVELASEEIDVTEIKEDIEALFNEVARNKKIGFSFTISEKAPFRMVSDKQRVEQVIKNLLSNAFKFTPEGGSVSVQVEQASGHSLNASALSAAEQVVVFKVKDTGIGIPVDKQAAIFEAFQQADGSTSRKYGGTGLGLSICRELAFLLNGEIKVDSKPGEGSTFSFYLPVKSSSEQKKVDTPELPLPQNSEKPAPAVKEVKNGYTRPSALGVQPDSDREYTLLIIEDDPLFAEILKDYAVERGFKPLLAMQGDTGLKMARELVPDAIILDIMLPVIDGWTVLKKLKESPDTYHIPVHLMSAKDETNLKAIKEGAIGFLKKPIERDELDKAFDTLAGDGAGNKISRVLLVEDQQIQSDALTTQLIGRNVDVKQAFDGRQAIDILQVDSRFDCIILDLKLPDISGLDLLEEIKSHENLRPIPVVINTAMELDQESMSRVMKHTHAMVLKSNKSNDRLLDEVNLFMNKIRSGGIGKSNQAGKVVKKSNTVTFERALKNKSVLIVDDDMRNIFALTSALQEYDLKIEIANNGYEALNKLEEKPDTDIVLMDIMMPEMDGYEAISLIRKQNRFGKLPIIALTAKAMKNDREKCIEAGANDYISKPVEVDKLISMMRVWLS